MIVTTIIGLAGIIVAVIFLTGLIRHDVRSIQREQAYVRHPHARKWRRRPLISLYPTTLPDDLLQTLRRSYRKLEIVSRSEDMSGEFILVPTREGQLANETIPAALRYFIEDTMSPAIELIPLISSPQTITSFLGNYRLILASMLMKSRLGLGIAPTRSLFPVLMRRTIPPKGHLHALWQRVYGIGSHLIALGLPFLLAYGLYLSLGLQQTSLLLVITGSFGLFIATAIWSYDGLSLTSRLGYTLLLPATLGYFFALAWLRPLEVLADVAKAKLPLGISFLVRIKDILRVV